MAIDYDDMMQSGATGLVSRYDEKDVMLYALGVGMGRDPLDEKELPFVYENNGLKVVPTFASVINRGEAPPERQRMPQKSQINFALVVDGERRITFHKPLPPQCDVVTDERMLAILDKGHTRADFEAAVALCRETGLTLVPTFVPFHPWMSLDDYCDLLDTIARLDLVDNVAPIQLAIRLLLPAGASRPRAAFAVFRKR